MPNRELSNKWMEYAKMDYDVAVHDTTFHPLPNMKSALLHADAIFKTAAKILENTKT